MFCFVCVCSWFDTFDVVEKRNSDLVIAAEDSSRPDGAATEQQRRSEWYGRGHSRSVPNKVNTARNRFDSRNCTHNSESHNCARFVRGSGAWHRDHQQGRRQCDGQEQSYQRRNRQEGKQYDSQEYLKQYENQQHYQFDRFDNQHHRGRWRQGRQKHHHNHPQGYENLQQEQNDWRESSYQYPSRQQKHRDYPKRYETRQDRANKQHYPSQKMPYDHQDHHIHMEKASLELWKWRTENWFR